MITSSFATCTTEASFPVWGLEVNDKFMVWGMGLGALDGLVVVDSGLRRCEMFKASR